MITNDFNNFIIFIIIVLVIKAWSPLQSQRTHSNIQFAGIDQKTVQNNMICDRLAVYDKAKHQSFVVRRWN